MYLFSFLTMDTIVSIPVYYMTYYLNRGNITNLVLGTLLITEILFIPLWSLIGKRYGKKAAFIAGLIVWIVAMIFSFAIKPESPNFIIFLFASIVGVGTSSVLTLPIPKRGWDS